MEEKKALYFKMDTLDAKTLPFLTKCFKAIKQTYRKLGKEEALAYYYKLATINDEFDFVRMQTKPLALCDVSQKLCYAVPEA